MPVFSYKASTGDGEIIEGVLNAEDDVVKKALQILEMPNPITVLEEEQ